MSQPTQPLDREAALVMFRSTLALHGPPSSHAARIAVMFAARMAAEAGMPATEFRDLATDEYALAKGASIDAAIDDAQVGRAPARRHAASDCVR